ncbi:hypothetical protein UFOVP1344_6 [uncultured Caudovirales phage]|uniref:Uncharacterized protein n=1 Tax=uncultured Caudovirales phage TaxID=2100421 RepID=A0A6J5RRB4_9CAUD|nr:hypothetical protein UFOVP1005_6 [uncultured Caudovirales phage]CAB4199669.1 hypothetical protein UFOVP1344_6 [uncultured Caudovirales phage]CAB4218500.1 hypothetical protein UFOVP1602_34 [uncultured Caudovirales phage]
MANRGDIRAEIRRELRDPLGKSWSNDEVNDLINAGINAVSDYSPREYWDVVTYTHPSVNSSWGVPKVIDITPFDNVFRVEIVDADNITIDTLQPDNGNGSSSGWSLFGGSLMLPEKYPFQVEKNGSNHDIIRLRVYGYSRHPFLDNDETATTLSEQEQVSCRAYAVMEALGRLMIDRANFQQWQIASGSSDVTISELAVLSNAARQRWYNERQRLRRMRRVS